MPATVIVNNMTVVHSASGGISQIFPDVCKTPAPPAPAPVPIPYPNIAMSSDTAKGSSTVSCDGNPVMIKSSNFQMSSGDEAGVAQGVASSKIKGKAEPKLFSMDVKFDGENVMRLSDIMLQNIGGSPNTPPGTEVQGPAVAVGADTKAEDPEKPEVTKLKWSKTPIACGDKVTLDVETVNFKPGATLTVAVPRNQKKRGRTIVHDSFAVPINGNKGSWEWLSVQSLWNKEIDVTAEQHVYNGIFGSGEVKMKTVQDAAKETVKPATPRSAPKYTEQLINGKKKFAKDTTHAGFAIWPGYDVEIKEGRFTVTCKVNFVPANGFGTAKRPGAAPTTAHIRKWKREIEGVWDRKWKLHRKECQRGNTCDCHADFGCCSFKINIKCEFVAGHHNVVLNDGFNHWNPTDYGAYWWWLSHWWWMGVVGTSIYVRAHEFGHLLGLYDEYPEGACLEVKVGRKTKRPFAKPKHDTIMGSGSTTHPRHVKDFKDWFDSKAKGAIGPTDLIRLLG